MEIRDIQIDGKVVQGAEIPLQNAALIVAVAEHGYVMCGYLNLEAAEKFGDCAAVVKGVKNLDELLAAKVVAVTAAARKLGIEVGMTGQNALARML